MKEIEKLKDQYESLERQEEETGEDFSELKNEICDRIYFIIND